MVIVSDRHVSATPLAPPRALSENRSTRTEKHGKSDEIRVDRVDIHGDQVKEDYSRMMGYGPGEALPSNKASAHFDQYIRDCVNPIAVAAFKNESKIPRWIGSAFGYEKPPDQLINSEKHGTIASIFVNPHEQSQDASPKMISHLKEYFQDKLKLKGIQVYANAAHKEAFQKQGFNDGDEMRKTISPDSHRIRRIKTIRKKIVRFLGGVTSDDLLLQPFNHERIQVRLPNSHADYEFIIRNELDAHDQSIDTTPLEELHGYYSTLSQSNNRVQLIAYQRLHDGDVKERLLGSALAQRWRPDTYRSDGALAGRELFGNLRVAAGVSERLARTTYLCLAFKLIDRANEEAFTQISIHQAGQARAALQQAGFSNGNLMQLSFHQSTGNP